MAIVQGCMSMLIADDDRRYRIDLADGEVALYTDEGDYIHLKRDGVIAVKAGSRVEIDGGTGSPVGVVTGACVCVFTGQPHPDVSTNVKASK